MSIASILRSSALALAVCGPVLYLTGCGGGGGGGGGGNGPQMPTTPTATPLAPGAPTPTPVVAPAGGGTLLFDDFSSATLDRAVWGNYTDPQELQRTRFGSRATNLSENGTTFTRLKLDSYNPNGGASGKYFLGTEIYTFDSYAVGDGLEAEARLRAPNLPPGLIFAFFLINDRYTGPYNQEGTNYYKDEIDFEGITKQQEQFGGRNRLYTNIWNNWNQPRDGFDSNPLPQDTPDRIHDDLAYQPSTDPNYDYANWNVYKIRWFADRTEFYVNGRLERIEREVRPDRALSLHFNLWTPTGDFSTAFSGSLPGPVASASNAARRTYQFDVDYVRVTALTSSASSARVATGAEAAKPLPANAKSYRSR